MALVALARHRGRAMVLRLAVLLAGPGLAAAAMVATAESGVMDRRRPRDSEVVAYE
jgi:hypothetical protein